MQKTLRRNTAWIFFTAGTFLLTGMAAYLYAVEAKTVQVETTRIADEAAETIQSSTRLLFRDLRTFSELEHLATRVTNGITQSAIMKFVQDRGTPFIYLESVTGSGQTEYRYFQDPPIAEAIQGTLDFQKKQLIRQIQTTPRFVISSPINLPTGESALVFAAPLTPDNATSGMAIGVIPLSYFYDALNNICTNTGYRFSIRLPYGVISKAPTNHCVIEPAASSTDNIPWLRATRTILVADDKWEISITHPTFRFEPTDIHSFVPFTIGGLIVIAVITLLIYHAERSREDLEAALARENEFVSIVSHQLREPVSQMNAVIETLEDTWPPCATSESRELVEDLHTINQANARIISNLLNISRLQRGVLKPQIQNHVLKELLDAALKKTSSEREVKQIVVHIKPTNLGALVNVDENFATTVIQNVLDNACKYSPQKTELTIKATSDSSLVILSITDQGPGIPTSLQKHLFSKEKPRDAKRAGTGTGLGLYIAKKFMNMMGGDIWFKTSSKGTTFFLSFPKGRKPTTL